MGIGVQSMVRRVPMMVGPLIGGALITHLGWQRGIQWALALCILLGLATAGIQWFMSEGSDSGARTPTSASGAEAARLRSSSGATTPTSAPVQNFSAVYKSFTPTLRELLVSDILIRFCERIPYAFVILWAMNNVKLNAQQWSYLVTIEMLTAMFCYIPVAHLADRYGRRPFVLITFVFFTLFPVTLLWATSFGWLALAFVVRGLKEFGEPARKAIIVGEALPEARARTYGAYYLIRDTIVTAGSFLGWALWRLAPRWNFAGAAVLGALGTLWFWWFIYRKPANHESTRMHKDDKVRKTI
jgi:MFS family permease